MSRARRISALVIITLSLFGGTASSAAEPPKRLLLLSQQPDGHPPSTHEYAAGQRVLAKLLAGVPELEITHAAADGDWPAGPDLLAKADGVVLFVSEGAKWLNSDPARRAAFAELAGRRGGLAVLHWGMGTKDAANIEPFVALFGACHGGPDRKYKVLDAAEIHIAAEHPVVAGLADFRLKEEFYYALKRAPEAEDLVPLVTVRVDDAEQMVGWAWQRPKGGRSFGFSGGHFHANWGRPEYQRLIAQGVLWTLGLTPPQSDFPAPLEERDLKLP
ncbi:MAG: ThuA domain-containing protein [Pirellulaceae bacterium]|nr:ThuA domain-containing protein [Pirellulaceae bacterium]